MTIIYNLMAVKQLQIFLSNNGKLIICLCWYFIVQLTKIRFKVPVILNGQVEFACMNYSVRPVSF